MLHRFRDPPKQPYGNSAEGLRRDLEWLRDEGFRFAPLEEVMAVLASGRPVPARTVVFTVDDGYLDFAEVAAPVFAEFGCPVTVFVISAFLDGDLWPWWDRLIWAFAATSQSEMSVATSGGPLALHWKPSGSEGAALAVVERLKLLENEERLAALDTIMRALEVDPPREPPEWARPMTWSQARELSRQDVTIGPHTVTHPILSRVGGEQLRREVAASWERVRAECPNAVPIFAYPNGDRGSFGAREAEALHQAGLVAAVAGWPGHASVSDFRGRPPANGYAIPRLYYDEIPGWLPQLVSGLEVVKERIRSVARGRRVRAGATP